MFRLAWCGIQLPCKTSAIYTTRALQYMQVFSIDASLSLFSDSILLASHEVERGSTLNSADLGFFAPGLEVFSHFDIIPRLVFESTYISAAPQSKYLEINC